MSTFCLLIYYLSNTKAGRTTKKVKKNISTVLGEVTAKILKSIKITTEKSPNQMSQVSFIFARELLSLVIYK